MNIESHNEEIYKKVKDFRKRRNLTQEDLASKMNTTPQAISNYESKRRGCSNIYVLAELTRQLGFSIYINNGNIYIKEDFDKMNNENKNNKEVIKSRIMEMYKETYMTEIQSCILGAVGKEHEANVRRVVESVYSNIVSDNCFKIEYDGFRFSIESALYEAEDSDFYFMDFRVFDDVADQMINAYLEIYHMDTLEVYDERVDDVWEFANWN